MAKYKKTIFIALEFIIGMGFGLLGGYLFTLFDNWDLYYSVLFTFSVSFVSALTGIGLIGYFYLKQIGRSNQFWESILLSFFGLVIFLILCIVITSLKLLPYNLSSILYVILPMIGAVIGFNYKAKPI